MAQGSFAYVGRQITWCKRHATTEVVVRSTFVEIVSLFITQAVLKHSMIWKYDGLVHAADPITNALSHRSTSIRYYSRLQ